MIIALFDKVSLIRPWIWLELALASPNDDDHESKVLHIFCLILLRGRIEIWFRIWQILLVVERSSWDLGARGGRDCPMNGMSSRPFATADGYAARKRQGHDRGRLLCLGLIMIPRTSPLPALAYRRRHQSSLHVQWNCWEFFCVLGCVARC
jgi:hypothetical protein